MELQPHPDAVKHFNALAEQVLAAVQEVSPDSLRTPAPQFEPDSFVAQHLTEKDIVSITHWGTFNPFTMEATELLFHPEPGDRAYKLQGEGCAIFERLVSRISAIEPFRRVSTLKRVRALAIDWLSSRLGGTSTETLLTHLTRSIASTIQRYVGVVPIAFLQVEEELPFGRVVFKPLDTAFFEDLSKQRERINVESHRQNFDARLLEYRKEIQGLAGAFVEVEGDPEFVKEHSVREAVHAVAILRFLAPEAQFPEARSYVAPFDLMPAPSHDVWLFKTGETVSTSHFRWISMPPPEPLQLHKLAVEELRKIAALDDLSHIARGQGLTDFEKALEGSLLLFSKGIATGSPAEKLVFVLVALESLLLRNPTEPIQQTVGDRFGFLLSKVPAERQELAQLFKSAYDLRSSFVHHGRNPDDLEILRKFLAMTWVLFLRLLRNRQAFASKDSLLNYLDSLKYS